MALVHASCVEIGGRGVLFLGPSGSGKSDLALRMIDGGAILVADDQVDIRAVGGRLHASPAAKLAGKLEVRGLGVVTLNWRRSTRLWLVVELLVATRPERLPARNEWRHDGIALPRMRLAAFEASTPAKVRLAVRNAAHDIASHDEAAEGSTGPR